MPPTVEEMTCSQLLKNDILELGYYQKFDGKHGKLALIGGKDCWKEIQDSVSAADLFVRTKLAKLEEKGYNPHDFSLPTLAEYETEIAKIPEYSDGLVLMTKWNWKSTDVQPGQELGLCLEQGQNTMASCWGLKKKADGNYEKKNNSYAINLALIPTGAQLSDYTDIGTYATPAFNGSWLCGDVMSCPKNEWQTVYCMRFLPKEQYATLADPRFTKG